MAEPYMPSAPTGVGTDDYRCFLLHPKLASDSFLTGTHVLPGNRDVVHHVILFRVPPEQVATAESVDSADEGPGWTCFGGSGLDQFADVDDAEWLGAWAPGGRESVLPTGSRRAAPDEDRQIVMQGHYNLLAGATPDVSATQLRLAPRSADLTPLETMLLPRRRTSVPGRPRRVAALRSRHRARRREGRFGDRGRGGTADVLLLLCGGTPRAGSTQTCTGASQNR